MKFRIVTSVLILFALFTSTNILASLSGHPSLFKETVALGGTKKIELHVSNSIASALEYSFTNRTDWIKIENSIGSVPGNSTISINIVLDASKLTIGKYSSSLLLNDPHHGTILFPFELVVTSTTEISDNNIPNDYKLNQNYPNPFNPSTTISFSIPKEQGVSLIIYDVLGNEIVSLIKEFLQPGTYNFQFSILNAQLSSGIYFYTLKTDNFSQTKKMILTK